MKEPINEVDKEVVAVVDTDYHCEEKVVGHVQQKFQLLYPYWYPCPIILWKRVNYGSQRGLEIPTKFHFCGPGKSIKLAKKRNNKYLRKLKLNCHTKSKVKFTQFFYKKYLL